MPIKTSNKKVIAYVTNQDKLLVFTHTNFPSFGVQVPAGIVNKNEHLSDAVVRVVYNKSGLKGTSIIKLLGTYEYKIVSEQTEPEYYYFYYLKVTEPTLCSWRYYEMPSTSADDPVSLDFYWIKLDGSNLGLTYGQDNKLLNLTRNVKKSSKIVQSADIFF
jgi:ADP-ribose pyrophosphatase YjhB (NUDIX family)